VDAHLDAAGVAGVLSHQPLQVRASMGSLGGDVLPRHLKTAYQLLKRRSLEKD